MLCHGSLQTLDNLLELVMELCKVSVGPSHSSKDITSTCVVEESSRGVPLLEERRCCDSLPVLGGNDLIEERLRRLSNAHCLTILVVPGWLVVGPKNWTSPDTKARSKQVHQGIQEAGIRAPIDFENERDRLS